jgi:leucyl-tRNA synthetase
MPYAPHEIEPKWQSRWKAERAFATDHDPNKPKFYVLDMFPYPSGAGLHVGHCEGYTATDVIARYKRAKGFRVLHPMGWDAFGLPAEDFAIKFGVHPHDRTQETIANFKRQIESLGFSYDWEHEIDTTDPNYYRWTQWIFLQLFKKGLAYQDEIAVNWCPALGTVLANEEVKNGRSERGGHPVERVLLRQWMLKITAYADRLAEDLEGLDWPASTMVMQREWIGRSEGAEITFATEIPGETITVFTTRPDTLFGATYMVLAPEHPLVAKLTTDAQREVVEQYVRVAKNKSDRERQEALGAKKKTGVFTGSFAINPVNGAKIPVWIADYVLWGYGTGAIMAVPAHDQRDYEFARAFSLPIVQVIAPKGGGTIPEHAAYEVSGDDAVLVNSGAFSGLTSAEAKKKIVAELAQRGVAKPTVNYKLRDWVFSRQRYWGEPIPIYFPVDMADPNGDPRKGDAHTIRYDQPIAVDESELPLRLPPTTDFKPSGDPLGPLAKLKDWRYFRKDGRWFARETNTMPQWAGSCWYYLRFTDPKNHERIFSSEREKAWMNVDLYVGGAEHAVLHLLYARFWHKVLFDLGLVSTKEPFQKLRHQGMVLGEVEYTGWKVGDRWISAREIGDELEPTEERPGIWAYTKDGKSLAQAVKLAESAVKKSGDGYVLAEDPSIVVDARAHKMSKSRGNVINPDDVVREHGADALRAYEMFMGDFEQAKPWDTRAIRGITRFLHNVWTVVFEPKEAEEDVHRKLRHKTIKAVGERIETFKFNTAIAALMEYVSALQAKGSTQEDREVLVQLVAPFAPHLAEECWEHLGHRGLVCKEPWPTYDEALTVDEVLTIPVQVSGKFRGTVEVPRDATEALVKERALELETVKNALRGKTLVKVIWVPSKMLNLVVK